MESKVKQFKTLKVARGECMAYQKVYSSEWPDNARHFFFGEKVAFIRNQAKVRD
jgi:hypothetical protein